jgi:hypothetical protein
VGGIPASDTLPTKPLAIALFLLSTATVLFTLAIFKLLSFFIMPSLFFDLLFVGFPIGAFIGARFFKVSSRSFLSTLWLLQSAMILSIVAALLCKHFDYLRAHLFEVEIYRLIGQMGTFTGFFLPFFCAYGLSEYLGYQVGRHNLKGRMPLVYALYLFGAAFAYLFLQVVLPWLGVARVLCLSIGLISISAAILSPKGIARRILRVETAALFLFAVPWQLVFPGAEWSNSVESAFLRQYKGDSPQSTAAYAKDDFEFAFQEWGDYSLTEIMVDKSPDRRGSAEFAGFYNDLMQWEYSPEHGFTRRSLGMVPINFAPPDGRIAIIGSGGGRQVRWAQREEFRFETIVGLELEPAVFRAVRGKLKEDFRNVYEGPNVQAIRCEARGFMEETDEKFDLIFLPSVGGYPQMMLEPGNMIRTVDAYITLKSRLSPQGILAVWYPGGLDPKGVLTEQYVRTLRSEKVGLKTKAYFNSEEFLILAANDPNTELPSCKAIDEFLVAPSAREGDLPPNPLARCGPFRVAPAGDDYAPISDDQPFLAGNVRHIFSLKQVYTLFGLSAGLLLIIAISMILYLRRRGDPKIAGRSYWQVIGLSVLIGANFLIFEHYLILALFKKVYVFHDALVLGAISFLVLSGLGSIVITRRLLPWFQLLGAVFCLALIFLEPYLPAVAVIALVAPIAFVTGSFFPALFELSSHNPLAVFAMDAVGAALGSMAAFFLPIAFGFDVFFPVGAAVFIVTCVSCFLFFRQPKPTSGLPARVEDATATVDEATA